MLLNRNNFRHIIILLVLSAIPVAGALSGYDGQGSDFNFDIGGDLRIREEAFDKIPITAEPYVTRGGKNNVMRFRSRLWVQGGTENITLYARVINEFRHWFDPDSGAYEWPDELIVDNFYLRLTDFFGEGSQLTVGRQDIMLGSRRMVCEGTALDGSRTIYMDGFTLRLPLSEFTRLDIFGVYTSAENDLAIGHEHRKITSYSPYADMSESGGGVFLTSRYTEALPFELYYIYKHDSAYTVRRPGQEPEYFDNSDYHTFGTRLMPRFVPGISGEFELAGQLGDEGGDTVEALMFAGSLIWSPEVDWNPELSANLVYLSGDNPETTTQKGWNPLWGRYPWISELYVYAWDAEKGGFWTNLIYPYIQAVCTPAQGQKLRLSVGPLIADQRTGPGTGKERGWLGIARWDFPLAEGLLGDADKLSGHLLAEVLRPGDFYPDDNSTSYFLRWELLYSF